MTWVMLASLVSLSCVLEPRESETPPDDQIGGRDDYQPAQEPEIVIENLEKIVEKRDSGSYQDLFTENFGFAADPEDVQFMDNYYGPGVYFGWNKAVETTVTERLFDRIKSARLAFVDTTVAVDTDSTYVVYHGYELEILIEGWTEFSGIAHFHMRKDPSDNLWYIHRWDDFRLPVIPDSVDGTWGLLKGEIRATT